MNIRSIIKKVKKRKNQRKQYYAWIRIVIQKTEKFNIDKLKEIEKQKKCIAQGVTEWYYETKESICWVSNIKERYISFDIKNIIKNLQKENIEFKIR